jgi:AcrR family transcriptional regulator
MRRTGDGHFDDLAGLLRALVEREGQRAVLQLMDLVPKPREGHGPGEMLLGSLRAFLEAVRDDPVTWRLVLVPAEGTPEILRARTVEIRQTVTDQLSAVIPVALATGSRPPSPDPELTAISLQGGPDEQRA